MNYLRRLKLGLALIIFGLAFADDPLTPTGQPMPNNTMSADKHYGITVQHKFSGNYGEEIENKIVDLNTKRIVGVINAGPYFEWMNHAELLPAWWSADDKFLIWQVEGKWGMEDQMLIVLENGEIQWELDILTPLQRAILSRTEEANPNLFLAAKKANWAGGSAYPEKFVIDSQIGQYNHKESLQFPLQFDVYLTSNCKGSPEVPEVDSWMRATLDQNGKISITEFHVGKSSTSPWHELQAAGSH